MFSSFAVASKNLLRHCSGKVFKIQAWTHSGPSLPPAALNELDGQTIDEQATLCLDQGAFIVCHSARGYSVSFVFNTLQEPT